INVKVEIVKGPLILVLRLNQQGVLILVLLITPHGRRDEGDQSHRQKYDGNPSEHDCSLLHSRLGKRCHRQPFLRSPVLPSPRVDSRNSLSAVNPDYAKKKSRENPARCRKEGLFRGAATRPGNCNGRRASGGNIIPDYTFSIVMSKSSSLSQRHRLNPVSTCPLRI